MNTTRAIINTLSEEDKKKFIQKLRLKNKRKDNKNIKLFQLLNTPNPPDHPEISLYGKPAKGAYHALCKRLNDALIDYIAVQDFDRDSSKEMNALKLILASRLLFQQNQIDIAFKILAKAELIGIKYSLFSILNEIYHTQIVYAHLKPSIVLKKLVKKFQKNKLRIFQEDNLNLFYATIQEELTQSNPHVSDIINRNLALFDISMKKILSYQSLLKMMQIGNQVAHVTRDYHEILSFIEKACRKIETSERIQDKYLHEHLQILYYLSNTYFRVKKFDLSLEYLDTMKLYMNMADMKYYHVFYPQYTLLKNLLYIYTGQHNKASNNLLAFDYQKYKNQQVYVLDLKLVHVVSLFLQQKFKDGFLIYQEFHHSDKWYANRNGHIWVVQKNLIEILLLIELNYIDLVESRINSFRKKHRLHLIEHDESIVLEFLNLVRIYYYKTEDLQSEKFQTKVDLLLEKKRKEDDVFTLSFYSWLKAKLDDTEIYKTCLSIISSTKD